MLKQLLKKLSALCAKKSPFDPAVLNDPAALRTGWNPVCNGGANFQTHRLIAVHPYRMEFRPTAGLLIFGAFFVFMGACAFIVPAGFAVKSRALSAGLIAIMPMGIGLVFMLIGVALIRNGIAPIIIDKEEKTVWKGRKSPREVFNVSELKVYAEIKNIHALQLISEHCSGSKSSYTSYELNLVLEDSRRINLVDHGNRKKLIADAQIVAEFLGVPLWNAL
jgi:hypothetical protein